MKKIDLEDLCIKRYTIKRYKCRINESSTLKRTGFNLKCYYSLTDLCFE